jgi:hypothetical protein
MLAQIIVCALALASPTDADANDEVLRRQLHQVSLLDQVGLPRPGEDPEVRAWLYRRRQQRLCGELWLRMLGVRAGFFASLTALFSALDPLVRPRRDPSPVDVGSRRARLAKTEKRSVRSFSVRRPPENTALTEDKSR